MDAAFIRRNKSSTKSILEELFIKRSEKSNLVLLIDNLHVSSYPLIYNLERKNAIKRVCSTDFYSGRVNLSDVVWRDRILWIDNMEVELIGTKENTSPSDVLFKFSEITQQTAAGITVLVNLQEEVVGIEMINKISFLADTILRVHRVRDGGNAIEIKVIHRRSGGKVKSETCIFDLDLAEFKKADIELKNASVEAGVEPSKGRPVHTQSTFNLGLTDAQVKAKAAVELPHLRAQMEAIDLNPSRPSVIYDKKLLADDNDDEDPDDDLDL